MTQYDISGESILVSNIYGDTRERVECVVLTYLDERGIARYELRLTPAPEGMPFSTPPQPRPGRRIR